MPRRVLSPAHSPRVFFRSGVLIINDQDKPLTVVSHRDNGGVYLAQAGKSHVLLSATELRRLLEFSAAATTPAKARLLRYPVQPREDTST